MLGVGKKHPLMKRIIDPNGFYCRAIPPKGRLLIFRIRFNSVEKEEKAVETSVSITLKVDKHLRNYSYRKALLRG